MRILSVIQPSELGSDFLFQDGVWKVNFPVGGNTEGNQLSIDENNALTTGSDGGLYLSKDLLNAYAMVQDNQSQKIHLYRFPAGTEFNVETATLASSVSLIEMTGIFDDVAIDGEVITFTDADNGLTLTLDTANLQRVSSIIGSDTIDVQSVNGETTISVKVDPRNDNALIVGEDGLYVQGVQGDGDLNLHQTLAVVEGGLCHVVGNSHLVVPQIELVDVAGNPIGYINDIIDLPVSSIVATDDHCTDWHPPEGSDVPNCRIGKVGNFFPNDWVYSSNDQSYEWRVFLNGQDTGYVAKVLDDEPAAAASLMSLSDMPHAQDVDLGETFGDGYLEEIISVATNGSIGGYYANGLYLWNNTNQQQVITLYPNGPINLNQLRDATSIESFGVSIVPELVELSNAPRTEYIPSFDTDPDDWSLYFDEERVAVHICLAPNSAGTGGGNSGSQISCAGATDRFATSGFWGNWTLKINGETKITYGYTEDVVDILMNHGIMVNYSGEMFTAFRNMTFENIRIELIGQQGEYIWDHTTLRIFPEFNPTLMGHDPHEGEWEEEGGKEYRRITVCLAPANEDMYWEELHLSAYETEYTLANSALYPDGNITATIANEDGIYVNHYTNVWGDYTVYLGTERGTEVVTDVSLDFEGAHDSYPADFEFISRRPLKFVFANACEYGRAVDIEASGVIQKVEVTVDSGLTVITSPYDGMVIPAVCGSIRIDDLEQGKLTHIVQGFKLGGEATDTVTVTVEDSSGNVETVELQLEVSDSEAFTSLEQQPSDLVRIAVSDYDWYEDVEKLPTIEVDFGDGDFWTLDRENGMGAQALKSFDFNSPEQTYEVEIYANLMGMGNVAIVGDGVIGVMDWGQIDAYGYSFDATTYNGDFSGDIDFSKVVRNNVSFLPPVGPTNLYSMLGMFAGTQLNNNTDLADYDTSSVYDMTGVFANSTFNGDITSWNVISCWNMNYAFFASAFTQDLSAWCVSNVNQKPLKFSDRSRFKAIDHPNWGSCPLPGATLTFSGKLGLFAGDELTQYVWFNNAAGNKTVNKTKVTSSDPSVLDITYIDQSGYWYVKGVNPGTVTLTITVNGLYTIEREVTVSDVPEPLIVTYSGEKARSSRYGAPASYPPQGDVMINAYDSTGDLWVDDRNKVVVDWGDGNVENSRVGQQLYHSYAEDVGKTEIKVSVMSTEPIQHFIVVGAVDEVVQWYGAPVETMFLGGDYGNMENQLVKVPDTIWPGAKRLDRTFYAQPFFNDANICKWDVSGITFVDMPIPENFDQPLVSWNLANAKGTSNSAVGSYNLFFGADRIMDFNAPIWNVWDPTYTVPYELYQGVDKSPQAIDYANRYGVAATINYDTNEIINKADTVAFGVRSGLVDGVFTKYDRYDLKTVKDVSVEEGAWWKDPNFPSDMFHVEHVQVGGALGYVVKITNLSGEIVELLFNTDKTVGTLIPYLINGENAISPGAYFAYRNNYDGSVRMVFFPEQP